MVASCVSQEAAGLQSKRSVTTQIALHRLAATFKTVTGWEATYTKALPIYKNGRFTGEWTDPIWELNKEAPHAERAM